MHWFKQYRRKKGQSLIEMLIAISLLTVALFSILALLSRSFFLNRIATNQTIATYLAAEGIELTKNIIDHDVYGGGISFNACCGAGGSYYLDYNDTALHSIGVGSAPPLEFDPNPKVNAYGYSFPASDNPVPTAFSRVIHITLSTPTEIDVQSIVTWSAGVFANQNVVLEDHFYYWQQ